MQTRMAAGRVYDYSHTIGTMKQEGEGFYLPVDVVFAARNILYVVNRGAKRVAPRITALTVEEELLYEIGSFGEADGQFVWPTGIALDDEENIYVSDEWLHRITVFDKEGNFLRKWGSHGANDGELNTPSGMSFDGEGNLYVSDTHNNRIQKFTREGKFLFKWGSLGVGPRELNQPWGLTVDRQGNIFVADWGNSRVQKISSNGELLNTFGLSPDATPHGEKYDRPFDDVLGISRVGSTKKLGILDHPSDVAIDKAGDVYVADWGNDCVHVFAPDGSLVTTFLGNAEDVSKWGGKRLYPWLEMVRARKRAKNLQLQERLTRPTSIALDEFGRIVIADSIRFRLQIYQKALNYVEPALTL